MFFAQEIREAKNAKKAIGIDFFTMTKLNFLQNCAFDFIQQHRNWVFLFVKKNSPRNYQIWFLRCIPHGPKKVNSDIIIGCKQFSQAEFHKTTGFTFPSITPSAGRYAKSKRKIIRKPKFWSWYEISPKPKMRNYWFQYWFSTTLRFKFIAIG